MENLSEQNDDYSFKLSSTEEHSAVKHISYPKSVVPSETLLTRESGQHKTHMRDSDTATLRFVFKTMQENSD